MSFTMKRVSVSGSLGDDLRELRERAGLSIEQASMRTKVLPSMISSWEAGAWATFGNELAYLERMLLGYVRAFGGRESFYVGKFHQELKTLGVKPVDSQIREMRPFRGVDLFWTARARLVALVSLFVFGLGFYVVAQARSFGEPPPLELVSPADGQSLDGPVVHVRGKTSPEASVFVNDQPALIHEDGTFELDLEVPRGSTQLDVRVKKRHSRETSLSRRVVYERVSESVHEL